MSNNGKDSRWKAIFCIFVCVLIFSWLIYLVIHGINSIKNGNRLKTEGVCIVITVTEVLTHNGKGGQSSRVKYVVGDSIIHSTVGSGSRRLKYNDQYWAKYLPDKLHVVTLLRDENKYLIPFDDSSKIPSNCNCNNYTIKLNTKKLKQ